MEKIRVGKQKVSKGYKEAKGATVTLLKFASMAIPAGVAVQLGILELTTQEIQAVAAGLLAVGFGFTWLRR